MAEQEEEVVDVAIIGAGLAGLALGLALKKMGRKERVVVFEARDSVGCQKGQGMSVIGHSLVLLRELGVDWHALGSPQYDISLRSAANAREVLYQVPLQSDPELAKEFDNTVQYNVHRGELFLTLLKLYEAEGGEVRLSHRLASITEDEERGSFVTAHFRGRASIRARMLVGADGIYSIARRFVLEGVPASDHLADSGYSCYRGMLHDTDAIAEPLGGSVMFKTVVSPARRSFTAGTAPQGRRFWLLDASGDARPMTEAFKRRRKKQPGQEQPGMQPGSTGLRKRGTEVQSSVSAALPVAENSLVEDDEGAELELEEVQVEGGIVEEVLSRMEGFSAEAKEVVRRTPPENIIKTDVLDGRLSSITRYGKGRVVLIGDAAHPVVHHFGQGACLAFEDAVELCRTISRQEDFPDNADKVVRDFDTWAHWLRCSAILLMSRSCGQLYMSKHTWFSHSLLRLCLMWPFCLFFTLAVRILLFMGGRGLRAFAVESFSHKKQ